MTPRCTSPSTETSTPSTQRSTIIGPSKPSARAASTTASTSARDPTTATPRLPHARVGFTTAGYPIASAASAARAGPSTTR